MSEYQKDVEMLMAKPSLAALLIEKVEKELDIPVTKEDILYLAEKWEAWLEDLTSGANQYGNVSTIVADSLLSIRN